MLLLLCNGDDSACYLCACCVPLSSAPYMLDAQQVLQEWCDSPAAQQQTKTNSGMSCNFVYTPRSTGHSSKAGECDAVKFKRKETTAPFSSCTLQRHSKTAAVKAATWRLADTCAKQLHTITSSATLSIITNWTLITLPWHGRDHYILSVCAGFELMEQNLHRWRQIQYSKSEASGCCFDDCLPSEGTCAWCSNTNSQHNIPHT